MAITKDQWLLISDELRGILGHVVFRLHGDEIQIARQRIAEDKLALLVYINGELQAGAGIPACKSYNPLTTLLWRKRTKSLYSKKEINSINKIFGKREAKKRFPGLYRKSEWFDPSFISTRIFIAQYKKIDGLELVSTGFEAKHEKSKG